MLKFKRVESGLSKKELEVIKRASAIVHEGDKKPIIVNIENDVMTISISSNISKSDN